MARISMKGPGTVAEISALLKDKMLQGERRCAFLDSVNRDGVEMLVFAGHFFRAGVCTLSLLLTSRDNMVNIDAVATCPVEDFFGFAGSAEYDLAEDVYYAVQELGFEIVERSDRPEPEYFSGDFFTAEPSEESLEDIMRRAREVKTGKSSSDKGEENTPKSYEPERVTLGREEKKGLFSRKRNKPDWEY